eukprot:gnl/Spiro4/5537_TR2812_c0_g1_i1.p1 gnl/Spiro4/5537_TR2812_c0_g1~~gnl/Spiro4/5537_TR2812_c0_g1_i1.p1  ORF type:complete len:576 (+),score=211.91 gnl/Spiro4/5537_TR2812_c0_g1_i1:71-1729(+)
MAALTFGNLTSGSKTKVEGSLSISPTALVWTSRGGRILEIPVDGIASAQWLRVGPSATSFQLRVQEKDKPNPAKFDGFREQQREEIKSRLPDLEVVELCTQGHNWGEFALEGNVMMFTSGGRRVFDVPTSELSQAVIQNKSEVSLDFHLDDTVSKEAEVLMEIRLFVPGANTGDGPATKAEQLQQALHQQASLDTLQDNVAVFPDLPCLVPRGVHDLEMFPKFFRFRGKTHASKIMYSNVSHLFVVPRPLSTDAPSGESRNEYFVVALDPPMRQGNTLYPHLVMQFEHDDTMELTLNMTEAEYEKWPLKDQLALELKGPCHEVTSQVFSVLANRKVTRAAREFESKGIRCAYKANVGFLFPLDHGFLFIPKPSLYIRFQDVLAVEFSRVESGSTANRSFDLTVQTRGGTTQTFANMSRDVYQSLLTYIMLRKLKIKNLEDLQKAASSGTRTRAPGPPSAATAAAAAGGGGDSIANMDLPEDSEEDDDDFGGGKEPADDESSVSEPDGSASSVSSDSSAEDEGKKRKKKPSKKEEKKAPKAKRAKKDAKSDSD